MRHAILGSIAPFDDHDAQPLPLDVWARAHGRRICGLAALLLLVVCPTTVRARAPHSYDVSLGGGVARVTITARLVGALGTQAHFEEVLPPGAGLASLRVCRGEQCFYGSPGTLRGPPRRGPYASAIQQHDVLSVTAGPLAPSEPLVVTVRVTAPARFVSGRDGVTLLGALPGDRVTFRVAGLLDPRLDARPASGGQRISTPAPWLHGALPRDAVRVEALAARCGDRRCLRYRMLAAPRAEPPRDVFFLLDVSPSTRAVDPEHRHRVLGALRAGLAPGSTVRRVAFAWRALMLDPEPRPVHPPPPLPNTLGDLGPATRVSAAWSLIEADVAAARRPLIVVIGDGTVGWWGSERRALDAMVRAGAEVSAVDLVGRRPTSTLRSSTRRSGGTLALGDPATGVESVRAIARPVVIDGARLGSRTLPPLRAGTERVITRMSDVLPPTLVTSGGTTRARGLAGPWALGLGVGLAAQLGRWDARSALRAVAPPGAEAHRTAGRRGAGRRAAGRRAAGSRASRRPAPPTPRIRLGRARVMGTVSRHVLARMRDRMMPRVRACFRDARRRGERGPLRVGLELVLLHGEVVLSRPRGASADLSACLEEVPAYTGDVPEGEGAGAHRALFRLVSPAVEARTAPIAPEPLAPALEQGLDALFPPVQLPGGE